MKRLLIVFTLVFALLPMSAPVSSVEAAPAATTIELLNPPRSGLLELAVDESYTFDILITSDEPFVGAVAMTDSYYPGRGVFWHGTDRVNRSTSAVLHLTITGKESTADLLAVCDWPEPGVCWPAGVAPVSIVAGMRYQGGATISEQFAFAVRAP